VRKLVDYRDSLAELPKLQKQIADREVALAGESSKPKTGDKKADKKQGELIGKLQSQLKEDREALESLEKKIAEVESSPALSKLANAHPDIDQAVLAETAKLHAGDAENKKLWEQFLPNCRDEISRVYGRLNVVFDYELGESYFHEMLAPTVAALKAKGVLKESDGAQCVFFEGMDAPMIVQKKDGAYLYATTDLATIRYRIDEWHADAILYVVDHRQSDHFFKLFAATRLLGYDKTELQHIQFGTILDPVTGKPFKTREGDAAGLEGLLDDAVTLAHKIVSENDDGKPGGAELSAEVRRAVAETVGIGAVKYGDLSQNRTSDYKYYPDKFMAMEGNTATYMQYSYARVRSIFRRNNLAAESIRTAGGMISLGTTHERALALTILQLHEALDDVLFDYRPNMLTAYLFNVAKAYSSFYEACPVLKAESEELKTSRLLLCDLTARTIKLGLELLNIGVIEQM
jgi:arginyl-tRNA synthetase